MPITTLFVEKLTRKFLVFFLLFFLAGTTIHPVTILAQDDTEENSSSSDTDEGSTSDTKSESAPERLTPENLPQRLASIVNSASKSSQWGVKVVVAETGQTLFESNSDKGFIPASNRKLFTGALVLDQLGPDYKFRTYLYRTGSIDHNGVLHGNLVIVPSGDPTFSKKLYNAEYSDWVYRDWTKKVQEAGIKFVAGDLLVDCSGWDMEDMTPRGWADRVLNDSYAPQTSPLTINANLTNIYLTPAKSGQPATVSFAPPATGYPVVNSTRSGGDKGGPLAKRVVNKHIEIRGAVPSKKTIWSFPIDRPTLYSAANFRHHLKEKDIDIQGSVRLITARGQLPGPNQDNTLALVESPPAIEIVNYMMKRSDNHMAEQLYVAVSAAKLGKGSYTNSWHLESGLLTRAGINPANIQCHDGSGLSETNRVSPDDVCKLLNFMLRHPYSKEYYDSMAVSGREGTLRNRMSRIAGRVHAKTGTINRVNTLSGYLRLSSDKTISFSFLVNSIPSGSSVRGTMDRLCTTIASLEL